jgi:ABC-type dipeptide/oligopeptide/nickel transport system permease subunit
MNEQRTCSPVVSFAQLIVRDRGGLVGLVLVLTVTASAVLAPWISPHDPLEQDLSASKQPPGWIAGGSWDHPLGTDIIGRDVLSRIIFGSRVSLTVGLFGVLIAGGLGLLLGLISGFAGGKVDAIIMSTVNVLLSLPYLVFVVVIAAILGRSVINVIAILGITDSPLFVRVTRGEVLRARGSDYVLAATSIGARQGRIIFRHLLPNLVGPLITIATFEVAGMIFYEAGLGFLGLSVPPTVPSWGNMLQDGRQYLTSAPWMATFPGLAIMLTSFGINLLGDWLRDALDPRRRRRRN